MNPQKLQQVLSTLERADKNLLPYGTSSLTDEDRRALDLHVRRAEVWRNAGPFTREFLKFMDTQKLRDSLRHA